MDIFSARLKWLRERKHLTQAEVAALIGMSQSGYTKIEQGLREPKLEVLAQLPRVVGESLDFMLGVTDYTFSAMVGNAKFDALYSSSKKTLLEFQEIQLDPAAAVKSFKYFDPKNKRMFESVMVTIINTLKNYHEEFYQLKNELIPLIESIPMFNESKIEEVKSKDPWIELGYTDDDIKNM